ncbi:MAG: hypothetical protein K0U61_07530, partial [Alphaproteobacteria bacterium]|nr:hypothetical protein [Alphaproteobacteria bacterium]
MIAPNTLFSVLIGGLTIVAISIVASMILFTWEGFDLDYMRPWSVYSYLFEYWDNDRVRNRS